MLVMEQIEALAEEVQPLLSEVRESDLVKDVETIAKGLAEASGDLRYLINPTNCCFCSIIASEVRNLWHSLSYLSLCHHAEG